MSMQPVYDWIDAHADECIRDLQRLVRQPSISAQGVGLRACAELVRDMMHADGLPADLHELDEGPPVVFGHLQADEPAKTLLCYSHYDVQPPEPLDAWTHGGPWSAEIVDGVLYGRGSTDNKSGVLAFNKAAKAFLEVRGEVPANLKLFIEGEEEIGSPNLGRLGRSQRRVAGRGRDALPGRIHGDGDPGSGRRAGAQVRAVRGVDRTRGEERRPFPQLPPGALAGLGARLGIEHHPGPGSPHPDRGLGGRDLAARSRG